ncbi:glycosyl transferase family protein [Hyphomicrobium denitrificans 1NES1]|uniref:Glycosyl transferase family protein n=1 Tax=Hyphomicrobium denitrificans 1NES1 TaxID=670307 RepID=N0BAQ3_9HYPH|nr:glycosyltransferase family 2 protein [Hyphomicrobium denitrificans]AGK57591.1 glycosyl transferase family protein [Hyphomicrobium denitrificans 1NES1]
MMLSVLIATMNRPDDLRRALLSLAAQQRLPDEVIVIDQSEDRLSQLACAAVNAEGPLVSRVRYFHQDVPSLVRARNRGVSIAAGEILSFLDDDVVLEPDYYSHVLAAFSVDPGIGAIGGSVQNVRFGGVKWRVRQALACLFLLNKWNGRMTASGFGYPLYHRPITRNTSVDMLHGCNMSVRRSAVDGDWFDDWFTGYSFREDAEFSYRVSRRWKVIMIPEARLDHNESRANRLSNTERKSMEVHNYAYVWRKHRGGGLASRMLFMYSLAGLLLIEWVEAIGKTQKKAATFQSALDAVRTLRIRA